VFGNRCGHNPRLEGEKKIFKRREEVSASRRRYFKRREGVIEVKEVKYEK
jgi:hypothetical protein